MCITTSPVLTRYDPGEPIFLNTDWSAEGMGHIIMQLVNDAASVSATVLLLKAGEYLFDTEKPGAHLQPIFFGSRACTGHETQYHSFVGDTACGPWAISKNKRYIWETHFY